VDIPVGVMVEITVIDVPPIVVVAMIVTVGGTVSVTGLAALLV